MAYQPGFTPASAGIKPRTPRRTTAPNLPVRPAQARPSGPQPGSPGWLNALDDRGQDDFTAWITAANRWVPSQAPGIQEIAAWQARKNAANTAYQDSLARGEFQEGLIGDQYTDARQELDRSFGRQREQIPYGANARGVLHSGIYRDDLQENAGERARSLRDLLMVRSQALGGLDLDRQAAERRRVEALAQIAQEEALRRMLLGSRVGR